jgi:hypothetical protein
VGALIRSSVVVPPSGFAREDRAAKSCCHISHPVSAAMAQLADSRDPEELAAEAYRLYVQFRPAIPAGEAGWEAAGTLSLARIRKLAKEK